MRLMRSGVDRRYHNQWSGRVGQSGTGKVAVVHDVGMGISAWVFLCRREKKGQRTETGSITTRPTAWNVLA